MAGIRTRIRNAILPRQQEAQAVTRPGVPAIESRSDVLWELAYIYRSVAETHSKIAAANENIK